MLNKPKYIFLLLLTIILAGQVSAQAFTPSQQQINQFKNMSKAQQEALARQLGIDPADFSGASDNSQQNNQTITDPQVNRDVDEEQVSAQLSKQSAVEELTSKLKPFGYSLFNASEETESRVSMGPTENTPVPTDYVMGLWRQY
ncbi:hypothetical protein RS130_21535 [Paraglaciecola aquimarina]|uniref:Uncharacterized protein n=1 Tax=Paraglaciecola aquimarina TaxID=1235557 RepID=A0ABU3T1K9_9ALTE|nr:hypothetical protein [Paraglaciecola aquimarina]MDU0356126.1 hypothetical protein [Paraglaciecola aquimarina]